MKTTITVETERVIILSRKVKRYRCEECGEETKMLPLEDADHLGDDNSEMIASLLESGEMHTIENENGQPLVCLASLDSGENKLINKEQNNENE